MHKIPAFFLGIGLLFSLSLYGQCPDRDSLWKRLLFLRDSAHLAPPDQLKELLRCQTSLSHCPAKNDSTTAFLWQRIGSMYYRTGDFNNAIHYLRQSIATTLTDIDRPAANRKPLIISYYVLAKCYDTLQLPEARTAAMDNCIDNSIKGGTINVQTLYALFSNTIYFYETADYKRCLDYASQGEALISQYHQPDSLTYAHSFLDWKLNALIGLKDYNNADHIALERIDDAAKRQDRLQLAILYSLVAKIAQQQGDYQKARVYFKKDLAANLSERFRKGCTEALNDLGYLHFFYLRQPQTALFFYRKALVYADGTDSMNIEANMGAAFARESFFDSAFVYFQKAFDQISPGITETTLLQTSFHKITDKLADYVADLLLDKGEAYLWQYRIKKEEKFLQESVALYKITDRLFDRLRAVQNEVSSQLQWRQRNQRLYDNALQAAYLEKDPAEAFYFFEKSRAVLLFDQLKKQDLLGNAALLAQGQAEKRILQLETSLDKETDRQNQASIRNELFSIKQQLLFYPHFADSSFISLPAVKNRLARDSQSILEFYEGDSTIYTFLLTNNQAVISRIDRTDFDSSADTYMAYISDQNRLNRDMPGFIRVSYHLYSLIFPGGAAPPGRIIISPDGHQFPFESLVTTPAVRDPAYLLYDHPLFYTYSARYLLYSFDKTPTAADREFMGFAPVNYAPYLDKSDLPGSDRSLKILGSYFGQADLLTQSHATKNAFLQNFSRYRILQLYTHAVGNTKTKEPLIYFVDSALPLSEIIAGKTAAELVVLSACETGNGQFYKGEGVLNFSRGFAAIGIPASIANLWSVQDEATYRLTELFYKNLSRGSPADIALQQAKKEFLQSASGEQRLPYFWAAPVLIGKADILAPGPAHPIRIILVILLFTAVLLLIVFLFYLGRRRQP